MTFLILGSLVLNPHFDPDDTRALYQRPDLSSAEAAIEAVVTANCYEGVPYTRPHIPAKFSKLLQAKQASKDKADSEKGGGLVNSEIFLQLIFFNYKVTDPDAMEPGTLCQIDPDPGLFAGQIPGGPVSSSFGLENQFVIYKVYFCLSCIRW
jgi:hypothetical protein